MRTNWYGSKATVVRRLEPLVRALAARGVSPDAVTLSAIPVAAIAGGAIAFSVVAPVLLILVPLAAALRLGTNLVDGALARSTGRSHPQGELLNEVTDRVADVLMLAPVSLVPGAQPSLVLLGVAGSILASFVAVATKAAGGERPYGGVLSKPGRMALLATFAVVALVAGNAAWAWFGPLLLLGTALTAAERMIVALRALP